MEYQSYHFLAVDRHLSPGEIAELRRYSTRAHISPTEFKNFYTFGWYGFKGEAGLFLERYFDVFVHWANWGYGEIAISVPADLIAKKEAEQYRTGRTAFITYRANSVIINFSSHSPGDIPEEPMSSNSIMASAVAARQSLLNGDDRLLYLGWLLQVQNEKEKVNESEPPVPPGLGELDGCLLHFCDFLGIDIDLREAAALRSPKLQQTDGFDPRDWIRELPWEQKDEMLARLAEGDTRPASEWQRKWREEISGRRTKRTLRKGGVSQNC